MRGAWVEINYVCFLLNVFASLPVRGAWVEMAPVGVRWLRALSRSPCGERGLKLPRPSPA